ncbi:acyl-CoA dehydrogenase family protein [Intestinimonas butyriciproducens]|uniref:Alkylation response protein AidB-like acyl-CoA dehydrogenase n=1 Tax=Intestinimonas butyriciproducens TaxID=1297617 RepID=A0A2U1CEP2_9FIRM|nr:acyl-CoA dehydrogenase family protein [Intestinimonas butyriciproducens]MBU5229321.1 acyl-CoA dehydrogenase family protein [Intestinimonas butyriciproducens]MCI6364089.1 acyl-CoA dehydrogenase family protein [Intestinimonas butyriciproducens]MCR1905564.1 acyl-CoA dehydrogenase family protein [Intestinimonas butyriciproducens]MDB7829847.1 acyl-CoA dehydrogenase family protein [Intestinimonas butyriciproducens]MDY3617341.1 acyl-CoA dehydrogenase family protein [Intestinimonas butyriciproducen
MEQFHQHILTGEQLDLQAFARDFAAKELAPVVKECDRKGEFPMEVFRKFCEVGFNSMFLPEAYGGQGLGAMDMVLVYEEFAKVDAGFICSASTGEFGIEPILVAGTEEQKKYYMDFILQGGLGAFALTEPNAGSDAAATRTTAVRDGDDYILNGRKCFITSGPVANVYSVFATVDPSLGTKGISCFIVERDRPGVSVGKDEDKMGMRLSCTSDVIFEDVRIPAKNLVGAEGKGFGLAMKCLDRSRGVNSYGALGIAQRALDEAVAYAKQRKTFGRPIIGHQGVQFLLADMEIDVTTARALLWQCAQMVDKGIFDTKLGSVTKTFLSEMAMRVTTSAVQVLGGYGYSREYPVEKLMRDAKLWSIFEGTNQIQHMVISGCLAH